MARCKLTRMSLRNIRKDKQYQCIIIDLVRTGVIGKSKAEELLGYTIPAGLLQGSVAEPTEEEPSGNGEEETPTKRTFKVVPWYQYTAGSGNSHLEHPRTVKNGSQQFVSLQVEASSLEELTNKVVAAVNEACDTSAIDPSGNTVSGVTGLGNDGHTPADAIEYCTVVKYSDAPDYESHGASIYDGNNYTLINPQPADLDNLISYIDSEGVIHVIISATEGSNA